MNLRQKIILFAIAPLIVALCAISLAVSYQTDTLVQQEREVLKATYLATKDSELKNYVTLARRAISHLYGSGKTDAITQDEAKAILEKLEYSVDGYFFLYDFQGRLLMHPKQKAKVGMNLIDEKDEKGKPLIRDMIDIAKKGEGFYDYIYKKFSTPTLEPKPKRAYVVGLREWSWMLGTGVYLDDIDTALAEADEKASNNIKSTMLWIFAITMLSLLVIISLGLALNIREHRDTLEKERERFAGELHEGICQMLGAIKLNIEADMKGLTGSGQDDPSTIRDILEEIVERIVEVNVEIRRIAHGLYPEILTDLGLETALQQLAYDYPATSIDFTSRGEVNSLPVHTNLALYRTAQAALDNIKKHANAQKIMLQLEGDEHYVTLTIIDDGDGFDLKTYFGDSSNGIGLRNMKRRIEDEKVDGKLAIIPSLPHGTTVIAKVPRKPRNKLLINLFPWKSK